MSFRRSGSSTRRPDFARYCLHGIDRYGSASRNGVGFRQAETAPARRGAAREHPQRGEQGVRPARLRARAHRRRGRRRGHLEGADLRALPQQAGALQRADEPRRARDARPHRRSGLRARASMGAARLEHGADGGLLVRHRAAGGVPDVRARRDRPRGRAAAGGASPRRGAAMVGVMEMEPPETREGLERRNLEQLAEMIVGGFYALGDWWLRNRDADVDELISMMLSFMWLGLGRMQEGSAGASLRPAGTTSRMQKRLDESLTRPARQLTAPSSSASTRAPRRPGSAWSSRAAATRSRRSAAA